MSPSKRLRSLKLGILAAVLALAGCGPLVSLGPEGEAAARFSLARLDAPAVTPTGPLGVVRVEDMEVPAELAIERILVRPDPQTVEYLTGARWTDRPNRLMRTLVMDALKSLPGITVLGPAQIDLAGDLRVTGRLTSFHIEAQGSRRQAVVVLEALLIARKGNRLADTRTFSASVPVAGTRPADFAGALNRAANTVATDVTVWVAQAGPPARQ
jgi:cholesterol transport system auxiliary component